MLEAVLENIIIIVTMGGISAINIKLIHQLISSIIDAFRILRQEEKEKDYSVISLMANGFNGKPVNNPPPEANNHFKIILQTVNAMRDEIFMRLDKIENELDKKADKPLP